MGESIFSSAFSNFLEEQYPYTQSHPIENPKLLKAWGLNPTIYRSLPKTLFHPEMGLEEVKPHFREIGQLKKLLIDSDMLSKYTYSPPKASIALLTWVYWDGWGDYYAQLDCANLIKKRFPNAQLTLITCLKSGQKPPEIGPNQHIISFEKGSVPQFPPSLIKKLKKVDLLFQFPTFYPYTESLIKQIGSHVKYECLGESGFIDTPDFTPQSSRRCMGLHFLEKGLFIKQMPKRSSPSPYFFAYTRTAEGLLQYLQALIAWKQRDLTLCVFKIEHVISLVKKGIPRVKQVKILVDGTSTSVSLAETGVTVCFDVKQNVPHHTFLSLLQESEPFVACTGDGSLFEAISAGKLFYYDTPEHKKSFREDLLALAKARTPQALPFFNNPLEIQKEEVRHSLEKLTTILKAEHDVTECICHIIHRALCHKAYPELQHRERHILDTFAKGDIDAPTALNAIEKNLSKI